MLQLQNKTLSDSYDEILSAQGVGWFNRKAISYGTVTFYIKHYKDDDGIERIDVQPTVAKIPGFTAHRILDWTEREHQDHVFGNSVIKDRRVKVDELDHEILKKGWTEDTLRHGVVHICARSASDAAWATNQV